MRLMYLLLLSTTFASVVAASAVYDATVSSFEKAPVLSFVAGSSTFQQVLGDALGPWQPPSTPPPPSPPAPRPAPAGACNAKADTSGHGNSLGPNMNNVASKEECCALCSNNSACGGWTWGDTVVHGVCFLRRPGTRWYHQTGAWSGDLGRPPAPPPPPPHITISSVFSSGMVLQRDQPAAFWGWTAKAADTVTVSFNGKQYHTQSASNLTAPGGALWTVTLASTPASAAGLTINVTCGACDDVALSKHEILVGDVHLCSGQSNMDFTVQQSFNGTTTELAKADLYSSRPIRILKFQGAHSRHAVEQPGFRGTWSNVNRRTIAAFSAVCWYGGRDTFDALGGAVPVGLIESDVGGTGVEFWSPAAAIAECSQVTPSTKGAKPQSDSTLYNGWIAPFTVGPMALKSLVWYQGESNTCPQGGGRPCGGTYYLCQFAAMIRHWRSAFGNDTLPFSFVLLAPDQKENAVADIRYGQLGALNLSHTAVVNAMDDGDCTPEYCAVHVRDKQLIGSRLSAVLLGLLYRGGIGAYAPAQTPLVSNWTAASSSQGLTVHFKHTGTGLEIVTSGRQVVCGGNTTKWQPSDGHVISGGTNWWPVNAPGRPGPSLCAGFEMQTKLGGAKWLPAQPSVGSSSLEFPNPSGDMVTAVRYAQSDWPLVTLYTKEGQPAAPFQIPVEHFVGPHSTSP
jgi:sialate O-acetylesterase